MRSQLRHSNIESLKKKRLLFSQKDVIQKGFRVQEKSRVNIDLGWRRAKGGGEEKTRCTFCEKGRKSPRGEEGGRGRPKEEEEE